MNASQRLAGFALLAGIFGGVAHGALAQSYPAKPIRLVAPFPPGGATDTLSRTIGQKLSDRLMQPVMIDNRPGAGGSIAAEVTAKAAPDGYTLFMGTAGTHGINPALYARLPYDPIRDFAPVALVAYVPNVLVVHPSVPTTSLKGLIALANAKPRELSFASVGNGSGPHLAMELLKSMAGIDMVHVPYKGSAPALTDLLSGRVALMFDAMASALPHVKAGRLRALAVTGAKRSAAAPDVPTVAEAGLPGYEINPWFGVFAPAGTPTEVVAKLSDEITKILNMPDVRERLIGQGLEPAGGTPEQFAAHVGSEMKKWARLVKRSGARID